MSKEAKQEAQKKSVVSRNGNKRVSSLLDKELRKPYYADESISVKEQIIRNLVRSATEGNVNAVTAMIEFAKLDASR